MEKLFLKFSLFCSRYRIQSLCYMVDIVTTLCIDQKLKLPQGIQSKHWTDPSKA